MLNSFKRAALAAILCMSASVGAASTGTVYDCAIKSPGAQGWIAPRIMIGVEETEKSAMVIDGIIQNVVKAPIIASVSRRDDTSIRVKWRVENIPVGNVRTKETVQYSAVLFKETGRIVITAVLSYFDNEPRGSGTCSRQKQPINF